MSIFVDLEIRNKLISHLYSLGTDDPDVKNRSLDLSAFGYGFTVAPLYMNEGEKTSDSLPEDREWIEHFLVKSPQIIYTQGDCGISSGKLSDVFSPSFIYKGAAVNPYPNADRSKDLFLTSGSSVPKEYKWLISLFLISKSTNIDIVKLPKIHEPR